MKNGTSSWIVSEQDQLAQPVIPFPNHLCGGDEPQTVLAARQGEIDKSTDDLEMELGEAA